MESYEWLEKIWQDYLPLDKIIIGNEKIPTLILDNKIRLFFYEMELKRQNFSIDDLFDFLIVQELIPEEYSFVEKEEPIEETEDEIFEIEEDVLSKSKENEYELALENKEKLDLFKRSKIDLLNYIKENYTKRLDIITPRMITLKKQGKTFNPQKKILLKLQVEFSNAQTLENFRIENIKVLDHKGSLALILLSEIYIDEEFIVTTIDKNVHLYHLNKNHNDILIKIDQFIWANVLLNYGLLEIDTFTIMYFEMESDKKLCKDISIQFDKSDTIDNKIILDNLKVQEICKTYNLISNAISKTEKIKVSIERLMSSMKRKSLLDIIIDLIIGLETAVLDKKDSEISYRITLYTSYLVSRNKEAVKKDLILTEKAYKARSDIVHGNIEDIKKLLAPIKGINVIELFDLVRRVILTLLNLYSINYFDRKKLKEMILFETIDLLRLIKQIELVSTKIPIEIEEFKRILDETNAILTGIKHIED